MADRRVGFTEGVRTTSFEQPRRLPLELRGEARTFARSTAVENELKARILACDPNPQKHFEQRGRKDLEAAAARKPKLEALLKSAEKSNISDGEIEAILEEMASGQKNKDQDFFSDAVALRNKIQAARSSPASRIGQPSFGPTRVRMGETDIGIPVPKPTEQEKAALEQKQYLTRAVNWISSAFRSRVAEFRARYPDFENRAYGKNNLIKMKQELIGNWGQRFLDFFRYLFSDEKSELLKQLQQRINTSPPEKPKAADNSNYQPGATPYDRL